MITCEAAVANALNRNTAQAPEHTFPNAATTSHRFWKLRGRHMKRVIHDDDPKVKPNSYGAPPVGDVLRIKPYRRHIFCGEKKTITSSIFSSGAITLQSVNVTFRCFSCTYVAVRAL